MSKLPAPAICQHALVADAIRRHDPKAAASAMREHVVHVKKALDCLYRDDAVEKSAIGPDDGEGDNG